MTDPITIDNISNFFELSQYEYRVFDMSRTVKLMPNETFKKIENQKALYPTPFQQHAWLGIIFWHPESVTEPAIWFLKFPIDELGFLKLEARDSFIQEMLSQVGDKIKGQSANDETQDAIDQDKADQGRTDTTEEKQSRKAHESAFAFKPQQDKMAIFNSLATRTLKQNPSKHYNHAKEYFEGIPGYEQWSFMGFQGLADVAANLDIDDNMHNAAQSISQMPEQPLILFSQLLEHTQPDGALTKALFERLDLELSELEGKSPNITLAASLARGLSGSLKNSECVKRLLNSPLKADIEILAVIASRIWETLKDEDILKSYLEALAKQEQQSFDVILMELLPIPDMREVLLEGLKNPNRSEELAASIRGFMKRFQ